VFLSTIVYTFGTMILVKLLIKKEMCIKCKQEKTGVKYYLNEIVYRQHNG